MTELPDAGPAPLLELPAELIHHILTFLPRLDLASIAQTCRVLLAQSLDDQIWQPIVNSNLSTPITDPRPCSSFRDLYVAHHPHWFLPRQKIWFADNEPSGKLLVVRYDPIKGHIIGHQVVASRGVHTLEFWEKDPEVIIHSFNPKIQLGLDQAVLKLEVGSPRTEDAGSSYPSDRGYASSSLYSKEILMDTFVQAGLYGSFMLSRALPEAAISSATAVWPPLHIPADARTRNASRDAYNSSGHRPTKLAEVSEHTFRLRKWVEYTGRRASPSLMSFTSPNGLSAALGISGPYFNSRSGPGMSIRMPEDITTYASLPERCYTPTQKKPWRGIWCGDYSGHGCEFLVLLQPDKEDERPLPEGMDWLRQWFRGGRRDSASSDSSYTSAVEDLHVEVREDWNAEARGSMREGIFEAQPTSTASSSTAQVINGFRKVTDVPHERGIQQVEEEQEEDVYSGRIEAVKLTGDPNIPRGEYTFIAPDIGETLRVADEEIFRGARVVRSAGHIAGRGFREGILSMFF